MPSLLGSAKVQAMESEQPSFADILECYRRSRAILVREPVHPWARRRQAKCVNCAMAGIDGFVVVKAHWAIRLPDQT